jgi:hypothetical protein
MLRARECHSIWRETCPITTLSTTNTTPTALKMNIGLHGERLEINFLSQKYMLIKYTEFIVNKM